MGYSDPIPSVDVTRQDICRAIEGWQNYKSAEEEALELDSLIQGYIQRGFCHTALDMAQATQELGGRPVLNKLGVITKVNAQGVKKSRVIWDLKESKAKANQICHQGERIILPRWWTWRNTPSVCIEGEDNLGWQLWTYVTPS